jgi:hypothetical protein
MEMARSRIAIRRLVFLTALILAVTACRGASSRTVVEGGGTATVATTAPTRTTTGRTSTHRDATAEAAITAAFLGWIDAQPHDAVQQYVQDYASIADPLRQGMVQHTSAALTRYTGRVDSVTLVDATHAKVRYTILFSGQPQYERLPGDALKIDGRWVVSRNTVCDLLAKGNIICPL